MQFHVVGDAGAAAGDFFALTGGSLECRSAADGTLRWADRPGWIGISIRDSARPGGGVRIVEAIDDSPGARVGLRRDDVIVGFDGTAMRTCVQLIAACSARLRFSRQVPGVATLISLPGPRAVSGARSKRCRASTSLSAAASRPNLSQIRSRVSAVRSRRVS